MLRIARVAVCTFLAVAAAGALAQAKGKVSDGVVKIGVLTDMTGYYSDLAGAGSVLAARMAVQDFGGKVLGMPIEIINADHQNKADIASNTARKWFDEDKVDVIADLVSSSTAGAVMPVAAEKKRITLLSGPATTAFTGEKCTAYNVHYTYNNWALANGTGREVVRQGGDSWYFVTADYIFGKSLEEDTSKVVKAAGGKVLGAARHPSPGTTDFSSYLLQAQASGAKIVGLANAGADTVNCIKQANEFGVTPKQSLAGLLVFISEIHALGLDTAKGMYLTTAFYWDLNEETRKWSKRFFEKHQKQPTMVHAGVYSAVTQYLNAVKAVGTDDADKVIAKMKATPVKDFFTKNGRIGPDGLHRHEMYLMRVKSPQESKGPWDYYQVVKEIPPEQAFPSIEAQACPLVAKK
jgi:branched-chain amino acid transport system substrate-binding protein